MSFDMNALMKQAQEMQAQMQEMQEEAAKETAEASAGGGMVTVVASANALCACGPPNGTSSSGCARPASTSP